MSSEDEGFDFLIHHEAYARVTEFVAQKWGVGTNTELSAMLRHLTKGCMNACAADASQLIECLEQHEAQLIRFVINKLKVLDGEGDEQEYGPLDEPAPEDRDTVEKELPLGPEFLMGHLCEFCLLKQGEKSELEAFVKMRRLPGMKKYVKQLRYAYGRSVEVTPSPG